MGAGGIGSKFGGYWVRLSSPGQQLECWQHQWRERNDMGDFGGATCEPQGLAIWTRGEEGGWGGAPVTRPHFGSCHCSFPSALSIFHGDRVPPRGS